jgi:DUF4097 and DUF4098 domain-containing protein YvlB
MSAHKRPSLLGGLLWAGLGSLFLVHNFGAGPDFWSFIGRYWPILLILLGLGKVIDYYRRKEGVALSFGEIILILLLVAIGSAVTKLSETRFADFVRDIHVGDTPVGQWIGTSYTYNKEVSYPLTATTPVRIENSYGLVSLSPGSDGEVRVRLKTVVYENDSSRAQDIANQVSIQGVPQGQAEATAFVIKTNRDDLSAKDYRFNTDLEVLVPKKAQVQVRNSFGELRAASLEGKLDLGTTHNTLDVRECTGDFTLSNRYAESRLVGLTGNVILETRGRVYLETIKGDVNVRNEYSPVTITDVDGKVTVSNTESSITLEKVSKPVVVEARGTRVTASNLSDSIKIVTSHQPVQVSDVAANLDLNCQYSRVTLKNIHGNVDVDSNSDQIGLDNIGGYLKVKARASRIRANSVDGPVDIQTTLRDVVVDNFNNACNIINERADVTLTAGKLGKGGISVKDRNGDIELSVPQDAAFQVEANAREGHVQTDYPGLMQTGGLKSDTSSDLTNFKGKVKNGGPLILLENEYGNIRIRTRGSESARIGQ